MTRHHGRSHCTTETQGVVAHVAAGHVHMSGVHATHRMRHVGGGAIRRLLLLVKGTELSLFGLDVIVSVANFAIRTGFMCSTMSAE